MTRNGEEGGGGCCSAKSVLVGCEYGCKDGGQASRLLCAMVGRHKKRRNMSCCWRCKVEKSEAGGGVGTRNGMAEAARRGRWRVEKVRGLTYTCSVRARRGSEALRPMDVQRGQAEATESGRGRAHDRRRRRVGGRQGNRGRVARPELMTANRRLGVLCGGGAGLRQRRGETETERAWQETQRLWLRFSPNDFTHVRRSSPRRPPRNTQTPPHQLPSRLFLLGLASTAA
ncbi:hypothetical protein L226DRAFT_59630 [Lentinus tigrinus ALCF2SS1-7]|uniref:Uncharacterized protein n=1 Tax=Lentinus tigrinus ALCF2SS1-6 TaxID=1328759 RepID=A0A5C2SD45_9APHY|nr:hypothetical protein L227DRAFT_79138 [Lentinus tigrinus ALCF2SS1-6]RPD75273.1 hypothetical protein L226DRAFT_59630 [Lentinus tigrinus ALCF2SS1-7]